MSDQASNLSKEPIFNESGDLKNRVNLRFWQELFLYYWVFSLLGHYLEIVWAWLVFFVNDSPLSLPVTSLMLPLAAPYGLGTVLIILIVLPLIRKYHINPAITFAMNAIIAGAAEYFCALMLVIFVGYNRYWDYSNQLLNINGYVCLGSSLLFGIVATIFIYFIYPLCEKILRRFSNKFINITFWLLFLSYIADWAYSSLK